jgi:hypothetical protein
MIRRTENPVRNLVTGKCRNFRKLFPINYYKLDGLVEKQK